jgi:ubiquinone/menaquinone biosynthesis C-methylase UbiE
MSDEQAQRAEQEYRRRARSFGPVAAAYDRGRPSYPPEAAQWLVPGQARTVLELGAGTGKLTARLVALGHDVHASDPDEGMLDVLSARVPGASTKVAGAEEIPAHDRSVDVVVCAGSFHWFDHERALPEIARVLKPSGHLAVTWNQRDERIPWVRRLGAVLGDAEHRFDTAYDVVAASGLFGFVEETSFKHWQDINRESIVDLALSRSDVAAMEEAERAAKLAEVLAFYDDYGRGMDGMQLPWEARCLRAQVIDRPDTDRADGGDDGDESAGPDPENGDPIVSDGSDTDMLLIDFR